MTMVAILRSIRPLFSITSVQHFNHAFLPMRYCTRKYNDIPPNSNSTSHFIPVDFKDDKSRRRHHYYVKDNKDSVHVHLGMPGVGKENVRVFAQDKVLMIEGEEIVHGEFEHRRKLGGVVFLPIESKYKLAEIKAVMMKGVMTIVVPKLPSRPSIQPARYDVDCVVSDD